MINGIRGTSGEKFIKWLPKVKMKRTLYASILFVMSAFVFLTVHNFLHIPRQGVQSIAHKDMIHFLNAEGRYYGVLPNVTSEYAGNGSSLFWREIWSHPGLDILSTPHFKFLPNYKNPCWYEPLVESNVYQNNKFAVVSMNARRSMMELIQTWTNRLAKDKNAKRLRCLPYFMIVGQPKCASTDIYKKIMKHPDVVSPPIKELHWWSRNRQGRKINYTDIIPLTQYIDMFDKAALYIEKRSEQIGEPDVNYHKIITGDGSVSVFWENDDWWHFPENQGHTEPRYTNADYIHHVIPDAKIIVSVRNPTDRLFSDYLYFTKANKSAEHFHKSVVHAIDLYNNCSRDHSIRYCIYNKTLAYDSKVRIRLGMYSVFLRDWFKAFPKENILVVTLEEYSLKMKKVINNIYRFLNLRSLTKEESRQIIKLPIANKRKYKDRKVGKMFNETRRLLDQFYEPFNEEMAALMNDDQFLWRRNEDNDYVEDDEGEK